MPFGRKAYADERRREEEDPEQFYQDRMAESTAWKPKSNSDFRAVAGTDAASSGDLFDPTQNDATRYNAIADNGNNLFNYTNRSQQVLNRGMHDYERRDQMAVDSRATADAANTDRPAYTIPTYNAPMPWEGTGERAPLQTDDDIAGRYGSYADLIGANNVEGQDYQAERVGDYGDAFNTWLTGAQSSFGKRLATEGNLLKESAAGRNRLNTGFYDEDYGTLQRNVAGDFSDAAQMAALDAAGLSLRGAEGNADRALQAAKLRGDASQTAYGNRLGLLDRSMDRASYLDQAGDARFEDDRNFSRGVYEDDRGFGRNTFEDDRNFGYGAFRDSSRDWESDRDFAEDRYRFDEGEADDARNFYANWLDGVTDRRTDMTRYEDSNDFDWGSAIQGGMTLAGAAIGGPAGAAAGNAAGGAVAGKGADPSVGVPTSRYEAAPYDDFGSQMTDPDEDEAMSWYMQNARR